MKALFLNEYNRLRSGWRAAFFLVSFFVLAAGGIGVSLVFLAEFPVSETTFGTLRLTVPFVISAALALVLGWLLGRVLEDVPFSALGAYATLGWIRHLALGLAVGGVSFLIAVVIAAASGSMQFTVNRISQPQHIATTLAITAVIFAFGAASEETLFRGYLLQTFARARLGWFGAVFTSLLFALGHGDNPGISKLAIFNTLLAGVWFTVGWFRARDLWYPFGMHLAWNWLQGPVLGINVSGIKEVASDPLFRAIDNGPEIITGGPYGLEGGIACTIALLTAIGLTWFLPGIKPDPHQLALTTREMPVSSPPVS